MITFWIIAAVIFCILFLIAMGNGNAESVRADELEKENRRLDMVNLRLGLRNANLNRALDVALKAMAEEARQAREIREAFLRQAYAERKKDDIETITRDIERGMAG